MKTYILMKNDSTLTSAEDIKVEDIYGIYQNRCKAFWECKVANLNVIKKSESKNENLLESYSLKEIDLESSKILNSFLMIDRNYIKDLSETKYKIPTFYNDIQITNNSFA